MKLPPTAEYLDKCGKGTAWLGAMIDDQLRAYGLACAEVMREECAKKCEELQADLSKGQGDCVNQYDCAGAIRAIEVKR